MSEHLTDLELELCRTGEIATSDHLAQCRECGARFAQLQQWAAGTRKHVVMPPFDGIDKKVFLAIEQRVDVISTARTKRQRQRQKVYRWLGVAAAAGLFLSVGLFVAQSFFSSKTVRNDIPSQIADDFNNDGQANIVDVFQRARELERTGALSTESKNELNQMAARIVDLNAGGDK